MATTKKNTQKQSAQSSSSSSASTTPAAKAAAVPQTSPNPPDPNAALEAFIQQALTQLDAIDAGLGTDPPLTSTQKRHAVKMRKGAAAIVAQIGNLVQQEDVETSAMPVADMSALLGKADAVQPLVARLTALQTHVGDLVFTAQSAAYVMAQQYYAILQRRALTDTQLETAMEPVASFFAYRHKSPKPAGSLTKPQERAAKKAVKTLQKTAPQLLQGSGDGGTPAAAAQAPSEPAPAAPAVAAVVTPKS